MVTHSILCEMSGSEEPQQSDIETNSLRVQIQEQTVQEDSTPKPGKRAGRILGLVNRLYICIYYIYLCLINIEVNYLLIIALEKNWGQL